MSQSIEQLKEPKSMMTTKEMYEQLRKQYPNQKVEAWCWIEGNDEGSEEHWHGVLGGTGSREVRGMGPDAESAIANLASKIPLLVEQRKQKAIELRAELDALEAELAPRLEQSTGGGK